MHVNDNSDIKNEKITLKKLKENDPVSDIRDILFFLNK